MSRLPTQLTRRLLHSLRSRKLRIALATTAAAFAAEIGLNVSQELVLAIVGIGASLILGIAHEDAGKHAAHLPQQPGRENPDTENIS